MKKRFVYFWILIGAVVLFVFLYLPGLSRYHELKLEEERLTREVGEIDKEINTLQEEKRLLQNDLGYLEKVIHEELGLVKPGEVVYKLVPQKKKTTQPAPAAKTSSRLADPPKTGASKAPQPSSI